MSTAFLAACVVGSPAAHAAAACERVVEELPVPAQLYSFYDVLGGSDNGEWVLGRGYHWPKGVVTFAWHKGVPQADFYASGVVEDVNNSGVLVGQAQGAARRVVNGVPEALADAPGSAASRAQHVNNPGDVLGMSGSSGDRGQLVVWPGGSTWPRVLPGTNDGVARVPVGITDDGTAVARVTSPGGTVQGHAWDRTGNRVALEALPGHDSVSPEFVAAGRIFGSSSQGSGARKPVEWGLDGKVVRTLPELDYVNDANASGQVLGKTWIEQHVGVVRAPGQVEVLPGFTIGMVLADNGDVYGAHYGTDRHTPLHARCG
ncbi:hypothetical protein [Lentzea cavernae]|uniref:Uncharacterized protein n=1 Tax=Lentzea cavernae TaxID=2020703 RepID=A0ABQ3MLS7_9PSEU|nr:hypothetical protein [Lentzea cavernae]GHH51449.1 hypothetical protein GCM10017774_61850 [Lentzea cavernae]